MKAVIYAKIIMTQKTQKDFPKNSNLHTKKIE